MANRIFLILFAALSVLQCKAVMPVLFGETLPDTDGKHVNAHGGNILKVDSVYYWYGESRGDSIAGFRQYGVACYTSSDLRNWQNRGLVFETSSQVGSPVESGCLMERPKVVYCPATGRYVMWFHHELKDRGYAAAQAAVATADNPLGPFHFSHSGRVNPGIYPLNMPQTDAAYNTSLEWWTPEWRAEIERGMFVERDLESGQMARDQTIFIDTDGKAYHVYSSEDNLTLQIAELDSTYEKHTGRYIRIFPGGHNEAPALFRHGGKYWMVTSGCTGWDPNEARLLCADSVMGEWTQLPNPCRGENAARTFNGQSAYIYSDGQGGFTFMADIWRPKNLADSRHIWLPIQFDADGIPYIQAP